MTGTNGFIATMIMADGRRVETRSKGFYNAYMRGIEARKKNSSESPYAIRGDGFGHYRYWNKGWIYQDKKMKKGK